MKCSLNDHPGQVSGGLGGGLREGALNGADHGLSRMEAAGETLHVPAIVLGGGEVLAPNDDYLVGLEAIYAGPCRKGKGALSLALRQELLVDAESLHEADGFKVVADVELSCGQVVGMHTVNAPDDAMRVNAGNQEVQP